MERRRCARADISVGRGVEVMLVRRRAVREEGRSETSANRGLSLLRRKVTSASGDASGLPISCADVGRVSLGDDASEWVGAEAFV